MKEHLHTPKRVVNIKSIKELEGIAKTDAGLRIGALVTMDELATNADIKAAYKAIAMPRRAFPARRSATWARWAATCASARAAGITARASACLP